MTMKLVTIKNQSQAVQTVHERRQDFPIFEKNACHDHALIYLDSAASAQKPRQVIEAMNRFYSQEYANIHRGIYELSACATQLYEEARAQVQQFIHAAHAEEIIFVRGATEGINLVAQSLGRSQWQAGDEVILSAMEHHANIVPWALLKEQIGIVLKIIPITDAGALDLEAYKNLFSSRTKMVAVTHASNVLGTINPVKEMTTMAHEHGVPVLIDGAQAVPHLPVDVSDLDCDFYVFSGHKLYGPTGIGVMYGKKSWLEAMSPYQGGGDMIETVSFSKVTFAKAPQKFEAGTPHLAGAIGLAAAIHYVQTIGWTSIIEHEQQLLALAESALCACEGLTIIGTAKPKVGVISFVMQGIHPHDIGTILDHEGIAVRAGQHCAMPLMERYQVPAMVRLSFGIYNQPSDIEAVSAGLQMVKRLLG